MSAEIAKLEKEAETLRTSVGQMKAALEPLASDVAALKTQLKTQMDKMQRSLDGLPAATADWIRTSSGLNGKGKETGTPASSPRGGNSKQ